MADKISELLDKFAELAQEEREITAAMDSAYKEYNDYCASSEDDLNRKIQEIRDKMGKLDYYIDYAREHAMASELEEAPKPFETSDGTLESIRQTIKLESHNDINAESLYTKATGMKKFYEQKIEQTRQLIEGSKIQAKRQYDSDMNTLASRKAQHENDVRNYIDSDDFKEYLKMLSFDKTAFNSISTVQLSENTFVSIGQRRVKLTVPMEIEQDLSVSSSGEYNSAAHTIGAPQHIPMNEGSVLCLEYDEKNQQYLLGGVQRLLLNIIKYFGQEITEMIFCEPNNFSADCLGHLSALAKGANPFIYLPESAENIEDTVLEFCSKAEALATPDKVTRVIVLHSFPEKYSFTVKDKILNLCKKASELGVLVVLTHDNSIAESELEKEIRDLALSVKSRNGGFWIEKFRESLFWYSAPSDLPEEIRKVYVEQRRGMASQAAQAIVSRAAEPTAEATPAPTSAPEIVREPESVSEIMPDFEASEPINLPEPEPVKEPIAPEPVMPAPAPEPVKEPVPVKEAPAPAHKKEPAAKGKRSLPAVEIGNDLYSSGKRASFDISGSVAYVCGKDGKERVGLYDMIVSHIASETHPDDAEMWIYDCTGSFMHRAENAPAHIRYLICDDSIDSVVDFVDALSGELSRRESDFVSNDWNMMSDVPENIYMPHIIVIINDFTGFLDIVSAGAATFGKTTLTRLERVLRKSENYGIHFVLFTDSIVKPNCLKYCSVRPVAALAGTEGSRELFIDFKLNQNDVETLSHILPGCAFMADEGGVKSMARVAVAAREAKGMYTTSTVYSSEAGSCFDKQPVFSDRRARKAFADKAEKREMYASSIGADEVMLFLGEPRRLEAEHPIRLVDGFGENIILAAPAVAKSDAVSVILSALSSLYELGKTAEILAYRSNAIYNELLSGSQLMGITVLEDDAAVKRIREISAAIAEGKRISTFVIVLGGDLLMAQMHSEESLGELKRALVRGSRLGAHFMFVTSELSHFATGFTALFRHRIVFPCAMADAEKVLRDTTCELPENSFRVSNDSEELTMTAYII